MVFCNFKFDKKYLDNSKVTILILVDGFLQSDILGNNIDLFKSHNPYFSRWFSAIRAGEDYKWKSE